MQVAAFFVKSRDRIFPGGMEIQTYGWMKNKNTTTCTTNDNDNDSVSMQEVSIV